MKKLKTSFFLKTFVLFFLIIYLAGSFTNMLCIPRYVQGYANISAERGLGFGKFVKYANFHTRNFLRIIDKSTLDNDKVNRLWFIPKSFLIIFAASCLPEIKTKLKISRFQALFSIQCSNLFFHKLQI